MIINKVANQSILFNALQTSKQKRNNQLENFSLLLLPIGGGLGWKISDSKYKKKFKALQEEQAKGINESITLLAEQEKLLQKSYTIHNSIEQLHTNYKDLLQKHNNTKTPEAELWHKLNEKCITYIKLFNKKESVKMPNCLLFIGKDFVLGREIYKWLCQKAEIKSSFIDDKGTNNILSTLEKNRANCDNTWHYAFVEGLEKYININHTNNREIALMKDIMSNTANDYYTTLVFQTKDISQLEPIALQPHRITQKFDLKDITLKNFLDFDKNFLELQNLKKCINDLLKEDDKLEARLNEITKQLEDIENVNTKIKNLEQNKGTIKGGLKGVSIGALLAIFVIMINKFITKERGIYDSIKN